MQTNPCVQEIDLMEGESRLPEHAQYFENFLISYTEGVDEGMYNPWEATVFVLNELESDEERLTYEQSEGVRKLLKLFVESTIDLEKVPHYQYVTLKYGIVEGVDTGDISETEDRLIEKWASKF
jgi:hypothetical protein